MEPTTSLSLAIQQFGMERCLHALASICQDRAKHWDRQRNDPAAAAHWNELSDALALLSRGKTGMY